jgi:hypothetical protein
MVSDDSSSAIAPMIVNIALPIGRPTSIRVDPPSIRVDPPSIRVDPPSIRVDPPSIRVDLVLHTGGAVYANWFTRSAPPPHRPSTVFLYTVLIY